MKSLHNVLRHFLTLFFACFLFAFFSCENAVTSATENQMEAVEEKSSQKAYIVLKLVEPNNTAASNARAVTSGVTSSLFSNITFSGTRADGVSITPVTAESFTELAGQSIEVEPGDWTFELEAWLGKTASAEGEKYTASQNLTVVAGTNELKMKLASDSASEAVPTSHPGSWEVAIKFPAETIDQVNVWLLNYSDFAVSGTDPASLTKLYSKNYVKGSDFTASGQQTLRAGETNRACGNYIVYVSFLKNVGQQGEDIETEVINNWGEFMRINPGVKSTGTITLPNADKTYTIQYNLGGAQWNPASTENIQISYTRNSGSAGVITLPTQASFVDRGPLYSFEGWYTDEDFAAGTGPVTSFNVSDAENKIFYAKWHEPVYDIYIQAGADDSIADGSKARPFSTVSLSVYQTFDDITGTNADGTYKSTIHILSDYTGANKITAPWGNNDSSLNGMCVNLVGEKNEVENADVELDVCVGSANSFIYLNNSQQMKLKHINITSTADHTNPNGYGCLSITSGTALFFEDSTIKGYTAEGCSAINVDGIVYLKNCEISGNKAIDRDSTSEVWANAVYVNSGFLHLDGNVVIKNNKILKDDSSGDEESEKKYNLYIGSYSGSTLTFHPVIIHGSLAGSEIWVKLAQEPRAFTSGYGTQTGFPSDYFHSDSGFLVDLNASGEVQLVRRVSYYVSSTSASPAGSDTAGDGSIEHPYASIEKAIEDITSANDTSLAPVIYITGDVIGNTIIDSDGSSGTKLIANSLIIEGTTATSALNGNTNGTVLDLRTSVPVTLKNLTIKNGQTSTRGGGLYIDGTNVEINNCIIENNSAGVQGGGVYLTNGALLTMNGTGSVIRGNWLTGAVTFPTTVALAKCGGGVYINSGTTKFVMNAGTIEGNGAYSGGGVYVRGTFEMNGDVDTTVIQSNVRINPGNTSSNTVLTSTQLTANVEVGIPGTFNMNGGKITSSLTQGQNGAGVCLYASHENGDENGTATFNMTGGEISGLNISENAAVYLLAVPSGGDNFNMVFNMSGGKITNNMSSASASEVGGAGVYVGRNGSFNMTGGEISNNHALHYAGGVYLVPSPTNGIDTPPTITFGESGSESTIIIKDNTVGSSSQNGNLYLNNGQVITVAGSLSTESQIGITRAGAFSASPFTSGFGSTNSGTSSPADIFTSDEGYTIIAGSGGEAAFLTSSASGTIYTPSDYNFTLAASRNAVTVGNAASVTVTPTVTRTEPSGDPTPLFYNPADQKLYLDSAFTYPEGTNSKVTWSASLWCSGAPEYENLSAGIDSDANKFTIPALTYENTYTLNVTATYQGYTHNANLTLQCQAAGAIPEGFVAVTGATVTGTVSDSGVFITDRTVTIPNLYVCDHEVTQAEFTEVMGTNPSQFSTNPATSEIQENRPVEQVSWYAAIAYCNKKSLSENLTPCYTVSGITDWANLTYSSIPTSSFDSDWNSVSCDFSANGYRLPTQAEWEYIARNGDGGIPANQTNYSGSNTVGDVAWYKDNSGSKTHEVKLKNANTLDIYDMNGNVREWCWDKYGSITSSTPASGPSSGSQRVLRGGSWYDFASNCTVYYMLLCKSPNNRDGENGFRVVRTAE